MNEWNNNEERFNSYDGCNSSGINFNDKEHKRTGNRNSAQNRTKARHDNRKDSHYLAKIVQQNETIIGLLKGIKQALNNKPHSNTSKLRYPKDGQKASGANQKKQYIQRFDDERASRDGASTKKRHKKSGKSLSDNSNVEVVEEKTLTSIASLDIDFTSENEVGEENPFTMFDSENRD